MVQSRERPAILPVDQPSAQGMPQRLHVPTQQGRRGPLALGRQRQVVRENPSIAPCDGQDFVVDVRVPAEQRRVLRRGFEYLGLATMLDNHFAAFVLGWQADDQGAEHAGDSFGTGERMVSLAENHAMG